MMKRFFLILIIVALLAVIPLATTDVGAQSGNQWRADYYPNLDWAGNPVFTQVIPYLNLNWGAGVPGPNMPADNWTMRGTSDAYFYSGVYRFSALADDEVLLMIDNAVYLDTRGKGQSGKNQMIDVTMTQGTHHVQVDFREYTGNAYITINWELIKGPTPPPPSSSCPYPPASAPSVQTQFGDYTPCIQSGSHQSQCYVSDGAWDSPNQGSIQMEPKITIWGNCQPADSDTTWALDCSTDPWKTQNYRCSKTLSGWFPS
ncbi:MAG: PA14 domain-containing protein [Chloroflexota bacterium]|nr:PA14 domain-containing protein [Chloroflexota bacterium]